MSKARFMCKFCHAFDFKENLHEDKCTEEHYHEKCRPICPKKANKKGRIK